MFPPELQGTEPIDVEQTLSVLKSQCNKAYIVSFYSRERPRPHNGTAHSQELVFVFYFYF